MTIEVTNLLNEKAKNKKDGVYVFRDNYWVVKNGNFIAFADPLGNCYQRFGSFNASIGTVERHKRKDKLKQWLKSQEST